MNNQKLNRKSRASFCRQNLEIWKNLNSILESCLVTWRASGLFLVYKLSNTHDYWIKMLSNINVQVEDYCVCFMEKFRKIFDLSLPVLSERSHAQEFEQFVVYAGWKNDKIHCISQVFLFKNLWLKTEWKQIVSLATWIRISSCPLCSIHEVDKFNSAFFQFFQLLALPTVIFI